MKRWVSAPAFALLAFSAIAAAVGFASVGYAQPLPPRPPGERPRHEEVRPEERRVEVRRIEERRVEERRPDERFRVEPRPLPPGERLRPVVRPPLSPYASRLQKIDEERHLHRVEQRRDLRAWEAGRPARELEHRRQLEGVWGPAFLGRPECRVELTAHADRMARIHRIIDLAEEQHDEAMVARAQTVLADEIARNARAMADIRIRLGMP